MSVSKYYVPEPDEHSVFIKLFFHVEDQCALPGMGYIYFLIDNDFALSTILGYKGKRTQDKQK